MEQSTPAVSMPGMPAGATVTETAINGPAAQSAPVAPAFVSPTDGLGTSRAAAMAFVDANRAAAARDVGNAGPGSLNSRINAALAHALHDGPAPAWLQIENAEGNTADIALGKAAMVDPDSVSGFAHLADEMQPEELAHYRAAGVNLGLHPAVSETMSTLAADFKMPRAIANDLQTVAIQHFGGPEAFDSIPVLDDAGLAEMQAAAVAKYGEDVITNLATQARQVLADKGLLQKFDDLGLTKSSMAFDRRALRALIFWGKASAAK